MFVVVILIAKKTSFAKNIATNVRYINLFISCYLIFFNLILVTAIGAGRSLTFASRGGGYGEHSCPRRAPNLPIVRWTLYQCSLSSCPCQTYRTRFLLPYFQRFLQGSKISCCFLFSFILLLTKGKDFFLFPTNYPDRPSKFSFPILLFTSYRMLNLQKSYLLSRAATSWYFREEQHG